MKRKVVKKDKPLGKAMKFGVIPDEEINKSLDRCAPRVYLPSEDYIRDIVYKAVTRASEGGHVLTPKGYVVMILNIIADYNKEL
jgi:hypothetical protein